jgi:hypothetical protein
LRYHGTPAVKVVSRLWMKAPLVAISRWLAVLRVSLVVASAVAADDEVASPALPTAAARAHGHRRANQKRRPRKGRRERHRYFLK